VSCCRFRDYGFWFLALKGCLEGILMWVRNVGGMAVTARLFELITDSYSIFNFVICFSSSFCCRVPGTCLVLNGGPS
jgi:hypothetical protein